MIELGRADRSCDEAPENRDETHVVHHSSSCKNLILPIRRRSLSLKIPLPELLSEEEINLIVCALSAYQHNKQYSALHLKLKRIAKVMPQRNVRDGHPKPPDFPEAR